MATYAPLIALLVIQGLLIAIAPSNRAQTAARDSVSFDAGGRPYADGLPADALGSTPDGTPGVPGSDGLPGDAGPGGTATGGGTRANGGGPTGGGDTSHCTPDGRQFAVLYEAPPCVPKWPAGADNGGATARGVTDRAVKVVVFHEKYDAQVSAVFSTQGIGATDAELAAFSKAAGEFVNRHYELYGRRVEVEYYAGNCPSDPPDPPTCREDVRKILAKDPFLVIWNTPLYPSVFDDFTRAGVIALGGWHFDRSSFTNRRPYRYDVYLDGSTTADVIAEYYCKKLAGKPADRAGTVIHATIGGRQTPRRLGIIVPDFPATVATADRLRKAVAKCGTDAPVYAYVSDTNRAQETVTSIIAAMIGDDVTTVACMCDPIAPAFFTGGATAQSYFPEWLVPGMGFLDDDRFARAYDGAQWEHAFGPGQLGAARPFAESPAAVVWRDVGRQGEPCGACNQYWPYFSLVGTMLQLAGPRLDAVAIERALVGGRYSRGGWAETGGKPQVRKLSFGPDDYTAYDDSREVYWNPQATSRIDGRRGAYVELDGGRRYLPGEWTSTFAVPAASR